MWPAHAQTTYPEFELLGYVDSRLVLGSDEVGWLHDGLGKTRYGADASDPADGRAARPVFGEAAAVALGRFGPATLGVLHTRGETEQEAFLDVMEAFVRYRPVSTSALRPRLRVGAFFPPVSFENDAVAWQNRFTISNSAINTWIGEEFRALGGEFGLEFRRPDYTVDTVVGVFARNDGAGTLLARRGWALHDRPTGLFERVELPALGFGADSFEPFVEIDNRPGFYVGGRIDHFDYGSFGVLGYDNLAVVGADGAGQTAWRTRFLAAGLHTFLPLEVDLVGQVMVGDTSHQPGSTSRLESTYVSWFGMVSRAFGDTNRLSLRYDRFAFNDVEPSPDHMPYDEVGFAVTGAWLMTPDERHHVGLEGMWLSSDRPGRSTLGISPVAQELQVLLRYQFRF